MIVTQEQYAQETIEQYKLKVKATTDNGQETEGHGLPWYVTDCCGRGRYFSNADLVAFADYLASGKVWAHDTLEPVESYSIAGQVPPEPTRNKTFDVYNVADWLVTAKTAVADEFCRYCVAMAALLAFSS